MVATVPSQLGADTNAIGIRYLCYEAKPRMSVNSKNKFSNTVTYTFDSSREALVRCLQYYEPP